MIENTRKESFLKAAKQMIKELRDSSKKESEGDVERVQREHEDLIRTLQNQLREKDRDIKVWKVITITLSINLMNLEFSTRIYILL